MDDLDLAGAPERPLWWRVPDPGTPELLRATYHRRAFARHSHDRFAVGIIERGTLAFRYRGERVLAPAGWVNLAFPGETHCGQSADEQGWSYRMFYLDPGQLFEVARDLDPGLRELPFVPAGAVWDPDLARRISVLHRLCEDPKADPCERQGRLVRLMQELLRRHSVSRTEAPLRGVRGAVDLARRRIEEAHGAGLSLAQLAALTGMDPSRLVRSFTQELGLPPHAYLVQVRLRHAMEKLRAGLPPVRAALEAGFADQSHLNRHFRKCFGITPGAFRRACPAPDRNP